MKTLTQDCINWIKDYYKDNPDGKAIIGISGGKDSTVAAALCVEALGGDRVIGVLMPNGHQKDINDSFDVCSTLGIDYLVINIGNTCDALCSAIDQNLYHRVTVENYAEKNPMISTNLPARLRMATLYAVAALYPNSRVVNTCNRSEDYVGYSTKYGDAAGDFSPLGNLTVREVLEIGDDLGLPEHLVHKAPSDGMCGKTDEDNLGFTYEELDDYILGTGEVSEETEAKIEQKHKASRHKYLPMPMFLPAAGSIRHDVRDTLSPTEAGSRNVLALEKPIKIVYEGAIPLNDEVADGGMIDPKTVTMVSNGGCLCTGLDIALGPRPSVSPTLAKELEMKPDIKNIENELWRSILSNEIRGIK